MDKIGSPKVLYENGSILQKMLLDFIDKDMDKVVVNQEDLKKEVEQEMEKIQHKKNTIPIEIKANIWDKYDLDKQIEKIQDRKIWLN